MSSDEYKICPFCDEEIKAVAIYCRHCKTFLDKDSEEMPLQSSEAVNSNSENAELEAEQKAFVKKCRNCGKEHSRMGYFCKECDYERFNNEYDKKEDKKSNEYVNKLKKTFSGLSEKTKQGLKNLKEQQSYSEQRIVSIADELIKLKKLLDDEIITEEEFESLKSKLLK